MTTVVLEGDEIDALLARVSSEHGPAARVVRAEKVRVGGVAGFFARQRFEVVVEVDDEEAAPTGGEDEAATGDPAGQEEGDVRARQQDGAGADARREEVLEGLFDSPIARALVRAQVLDDAAEAAGRGADGDPAGAPAAGAPGSAAGGLASLLDAADAEDAHRPGPASASVSGRHAVPSQPLEPSRPVSTESAAFAAVLDAVRDAAEPDAAGGRADEQPARPESGPPAGGRPVSAPAEEHGDEVGPPAGPEPVPAGAAVAELMGLLAARHAAARAGEAPEEQASSQDRGREGAAPEEPAHEDGAPQDAAPQDGHRDDAPAGSVAQDVTTSSPPATTVEDATAPAPGAPSVTGAPDGVRSRAAAAGLPVHLLERLPERAGPGDLRAVLAALPAAPALPDGEGDLVVVVGAPRDALVAARSLASRLGLGPDGVVVAARPGGGVLRREVVRDAAAARRAAATVRLGDGPGVVVVQADCDPDDVRWARDVVSALRADQVHAVVDATRKPADTDRWFDAVLARDPDAVHVVRAAGSADPGSALGLDLPVAAVDGGAAGADAWVELLLREPLAPPADAPARPRRRRAATPGRP